jgi:hypothetical protein
MQGSCELYTHLGKSEEEERGGDTLPKQPSRVHSKSSSKHQNYGPHSMDKFSRPVETGTGFVTHVYMWQVHIQWGRNHPCQRLHQHLDLYSSKAHGRSFDLANTNMAISNVRYRTPTCLDSGFESCVERRHMRTSQRDPDRLVLLSAFQWRKLRACVYCKILCK